MAKLYRVTLTPSERQDLQLLISKGKAAARKLARARILLQADEADGGPACIDQEIAAALNTTTRTVERVRQRFVEQGLEAAVSPAVSHRIYQRKLDGRQEAKLIQLACSAAPTGKSRWTLRLLAQQMVELKVVDELSHETVRRTLKKTS